MSIHPEGLRSENPIVNFTLYSLEQQDRLKGLEEFFAEAFEVVINPELANTKFREEDRLDLAIDHPAEMMPIHQPRDAYSRVTNNFAPKFSMYTGSLDTGERDSRDQPIHKSVPATKEEVLALRELPKFKDIDEILDMVESGTYPALSIHNHSCRESFLRTLVLFPKFTSGLVAGMSTLESQDHYYRYEPELFVAYQLMSRLVDESDLYVLNKEGKVEAWDLCK